MKIFKIDVHNLETDEPDIKIYYWATLAKGYLYNESTEQNIQIGVDTCKERGKQIIRDS